MKGRRQVGGAWRRLRLGGAGNVAGEVRLAVSSRLSPVPSSSMVGGGFRVDQQCKQSRESGAGVLLLKKYLP